MTKQERHNELVAEFERHCQGDKRSHFERRPIINMEYTAMRCGVTKCGWYFEIIG